MTLVFATGLTITGYRYDIQDNDLGHIVARAGGFRSEAEAQLEATQAIARRYRNAIEADGHIVGPRCGDLTAVDGVWRDDAAIERLANQYNTPRR